MDNKPSSLQQAWDSATDEERAELVAMIMDLSVDSLLWSKVNIGRISSVEFNPDIIALSARPVLPITVEIASARPSTPRRDSMAESIAAQIEGGGWGRTD